MHALIIWAVSEYVEFCKLAYQIDQVHAQAKAYRGYVRMCACMCG